MKGIFRWIASGCLFAPLIVLAGPVNINTADAESIARELKGVGMSKARAIVDYRTRNGEFEVAEDLLKVKGIGATVLQDNRDDIVVAE